MASRRGWTSNQDKQSTLSYFLEPALRLATPMSRLFGLQNRTGVSQGEVPQYTVEAAMEKAIANLAGARGADVKVDITIPQVTMVVQMTVLHSATHMTYVCFAASAVPGGYAIG